MIHPFNILEGGVNYSLGKFDGQNVIYDFPKILLYLAVKGKMLFGQNFRIYEEDKEILLMLCNYFIKDLDNCKGPFAFRPCRVWEDKSYKAFEIHCATSTRL